MADQEKQETQQQNHMPVDPFTQLMWGPPPGQHPFMPMAPPNAQQPQQNQGQTAAGNNGTPANPFDFDKLMNSADKMFKIINQTQPMFKQLGPLINMFKK